MKEVKKFKVGSYAYVKGNKKYVAYKGNILRIIDNDCGEPFPYSGEVVYSKNGLVIGDTCSFGEDELKPISEKRLLAHLI